MSLETTKVALSTPLLGEGERAEEERGSDHQHLQSTTRSEGCNVLEPQQDTEPSESDNEILAGILLWGPWWGPQYRYPLFQLGYSPPIRGNPLPGRILQYITAASSEGSVAVRTEEVETLWNDLLEEIEPAIARLVNTKKKLQGIGILLYIAAHLTLPVVLAIEIHKFWYVILAIEVGMLGTLCLWFILVELFFHRRRISVQEIMEQHNERFKTTARMQIKARTKYAPISIYNPGGNTAAAAAAAAAATTATVSSSGERENFATYCFKACEIHLVIQKYTPVEERQAEIAFV